MARSILGIDVGDIVTMQNRGRSVRLSVARVSIYASAEGVIFSVDGTRFRKDGTVGKQFDTIRLCFPNDI